VSNSKLLKRLRDMFPGDNTGFNTFDLIHKFGSPLSALLYSELFWPEFVEYKGMIFLASEVEDTAGRNRVDGALATYGGDRGQVEESFNFVEVPPLFGARSGETTDLEDQLLANKLASMWCARLLQVFPDRKFVVTVTEQGDTGEEIGVLFYQTSKD